MKAYCIYHGSLRWPQNDRCLTFYNVLYMSYTVKNTYITLKTLHITSLYSNMAQSLKRIEGSACMLKNKKAKKNKKYKK